MVLDCPTGNTSCRVNDAKPDQCATYPFWPRILRDREAWEVEGESCAGIGSGTPIPAGDPAPTADVEGSAAPALAIADGETLALDAEQVRGMLHEMPEDTPKEQLPYYQLSREFSGKVIVIALGRTEWKMRPAARLLGISPVKLRQDLKVWIEYGLEAADGTDLTPVPGPATASGRSSRPGRPPGARGRGSAGAAEDLR